MEPKLLNMTLPEALHKFAEMDMAYMHGQPKHNNFKNFAKTLGTYAALGTALAVAGHGVNEGVAYIKSSRKRARMAPLFEEMMTLHPRLKSLDKDRVKLFYEQLWHFSPKVAENPLAAGNYVYYALQYDTTAGGPGITAFKELSELEETSAKTAPLALNVGESLSNSASLMSHTNYDPFSLNKMSSVNSEMPVDPRTGVAMVKRSR